MANATMQTMCFPDYGGPEVLVLEQAPCPQPKENEVFLRLLSAGVNPADWKYASGVFKQFAPLQFPWIPGLEGAGIVEAVGPGVTALRPGQAVYGVFSGAYAEYATAPATDLVLKPSRLTFDEAAAVPIGALTAWGAVVDSGAVQAGQRVLVHGAAGGVGLFAVQLAHWKGAHVIGTASASNAEFVRSLGADEVIDYQAVPFETVVRDIDVVIDTVGGEVIERSWQILKPGGILVTVAGTLAPDAGASHGVRGIGAGRAKPENLKPISELIESNQIKSVVGSVFPLAKARQALELSLTRHGRGRIILHIADR